MEKLKCRIKIQDCEFEAEGHQAFVREQFEVFRQLLVNVPQKQVLSELRSEANIFQSKEPPSPSLPLARHPPLPHLSVTSLHKLLTWDDRTRQVTCEVIPTGPLRAADTVLLLLLGYREFQGVTEVPALVLNRGLKSAGFSQLRLDRIMAPYLKDRRVLRAGVGKGGRYRLTTRGVEKAQDLAQTLAALLPDPLPD